MKVYRSLHDFAKDMKERSEMRKEDFIFLFIALLLIILFITI